MSIPVDTRNGQTHHCHAVYCLLLPRGQGRIEEHVAMLQHAKTSVQRVIGCGSA